MARIKPNKGKFVTKYFKKKASQVFTANELVAFGANGTVNPATATSTEIIGLSQRTITAADSDYASNTKIPVTVPASDDATFLAEGEAHGCTEAMNGEYVDITDANTINGAANALEVIKVEQFIDSNTVEFALAKKSGVAASVNAD